MIELTDLQIERFSRQIILPEIGATRQQALLDSRSTVVSTLQGGSVAAAYLAAAGVGEVRIVLDQNQALAGPQSLLLASGERPTDADEQTEMAGLASSLSRYNPDTNVVVHSSDELSSAVAGAHLVVALTAGNLGDLSHLCRSLGIPLLWGKARKGRLIAGLDVAAGACWRCAESGAGAEGERLLEPSLAIAAEALLASILAAEAIKLLAGLGGALTGKLLLLDPLAIRPGEIPAEPRPGCPACQDQAELV